MENDRILRLAEKIFLGVIVRDSDSYVDRRATSHAAAQESFRLAEEFYSVAHTRQVNKINDTVTTRNGEVLL